MATPIFKEFAAGIRDVKDGRFFPFHARVFAPGTDILPQKPNRRYFLKSAVISIASLGTDTGTAATLSSTQDNESVSLAELVKTASVVNLASTGFRIGVLLDKEAVIAFTAPDITTASVQLVYAEVDDLE